MPFNIGPGELLLFVVVGLVVVGVPIMILAGIFFSNRDRNRPDD